MGQILQMQHQVMLVIELNDLVLQILVVVGELGRVRANHTLILSNIGFSLMKTITNVSNFTFKGFESHKKVGFGIDSNLVGLLVKNAGLPIELRNLSIVMTVA